MWILWYHDRSFRYGTEEVYGLNQYDLVSCRFEVNKSPQLHFRVNEVFNYQIDLLEKFNGYHFVIGR
jgi:hypothetical protein